jgi:hypothetical protein
MLIIQSYIIYHVESTRLIVYIWGDSRAERARIDWPPAEPALIAGSRMHGSTTTDPGHDGRRARKIIPLLRGIGPIRVPTGAIRHD